MLRWLPSLRIYSAVQRLAQPLALKPQLLSRSPACVRVFLPDELQHVFEFLMHEDCLREEGMDAGGMFVIEAGLGGFDFLSNVHACGGSRRRDVD